MEEHPLISVIVLNWNGSRLLEQCLASVMAQTYPHLEIIIPDNGSTDGSVDLVKKKFPGVHLIENGKNLGYGGGNNPGIRASRGAYVMILRMNIADTDVSDLTDCGRLVEFFESTHFHEMSPHDELKFAGTEYVLADPGVSTIVYASALAGRIGVRQMTAGTYDFTWFDCKTGKTVTQRRVKVAAGEQSWERPAGLGIEIAVHIRRSRRE